MNPEIRLRRDERAALLLLTVNQGARIDPLVRMKLLARGFVMPSGHGDALTPAGRATMATRAWVLEGRDRTGYWDWSNIGGSPSATKLSDGQIAFLDAGDAQRALDDLLLRSKSWKMGPPWKREDLRIVEVATSALPDAIRQALGVAK